ncbi:MAG: radical SAM protein [Ruminococcaceae bacterium]|nr:radical SAM protein [Oscillospiraceae bacterium]
MKNDNAVRAPIVGYSRHRLATDGQGVTTLVIFHGCPLRCRWCINPYTFDPNTKYTQTTPEELYDKLKVDDIYFRATGGGVTFGGGEPLLYADFLQSFRALCGDSWHLCVETSLSVPWKNVAVAAECIDTFYIDCKDTNENIYRAYTGKDNSLMLENLEKLAKKIPVERIVVRLPLIPEFNTDADRQKSKKLLSQMGITCFDAFEYKIKTKK